MHDAAAIEAPDRKKPILAAPRAAIPSSAELCLVISSALLLILAFPDFELWPLAWIGLVPFLLVVARPLKARRALLLGWLWGAVFFYGSCWWLTYPMTHFAKISRWLAFPLLLIPIVLVAVFPALFSLCLSRLVARFGFAAMLTAPLLWVSFEWSRYAVTGQLWNALGYSQAFHSFLIQPARWGSVYAVSFLIVAVNTALVFSLMRFTKRRVAVSISVIAFILLTLYANSAGTRGERLMTAPSAALIVVQPDVPMQGGDDAALLQRHLELSLEGLRAAPLDPTVSRLVIWPESPMNFTYSSDPHLQEVVSNLARSNHTSVLLNSLELGSNGDEFNSAVMSNEEGRIVARYDKIRLMPFGEYVPLPQWLPGASSVRGIVGDFTPGSSYTLMPLGAFRVGVFICIEAAYPSVARSFANEGADVLINISNDGYLGPTPVRRQHLSNAVFRAVENNRDLARVTNNGITAQIDSNGRIWDSTVTTQPAVRVWLVGSSGKGKTFYTKYGDIFVYACALISLGLISATFRTRRTRASISQERG